MKAAWLRKFPEEARLGIPGVTDEEDAPELTPNQSSVLRAALVARDAQLENWFRHHAKKTTTVSAAQTNAKLHPLEIDAALNAAGCFGLNEERASQENQACQMAIQTEVVKSLYRKASEEEKDAIDVMIDEERKLLAKKKTKKEKGMNAEEDEIEMRPEDYQCHIDESPGVISKVHNVVGKKTGWFEFTVYGGPNPRYNSNLSMKVICFGRSPAGNNFQAAHGSFDDSISVPFQAFLKRSFSESRVFPVLSVTCKPSGASCDAGETRKGQVCGEEKEDPTVPAAASACSAPTPAASSSDEGPEVLLSSDEQPSYDLSDSALDFSSWSDEHASYSPFSSAPPSLPVSPSPGSDLDTFDGHGADLDLDDLLATGTDSAMWPGGMAAPPIPAMVSALAFAERGA
ncbi:hypothetical protein B0H17DRAFT_1215418 [Mycena rosella]|uniref:Uncharacterized protein n=1 Tax=Mycena rosella TaxID=1033263 RepID=A0AAD7CHJ3_MYCRO|nr:hypothetical protein B0H17DRAFT_1215418 [Mycena rosella]